VSDVRWDFQAPRITKSQPTKFKGRYKALRKQVICGIYFERQRALSWASPESHFHGLEIPGCTELNS